MTLGTTLGVATSARAQAWVPPEGVGSVDVIYQVIDNTGHTLNDGSLVPDGKSITEGVYVEATYAITDRLSVSGGLPYIFARYRGPGPALAALPVDNCKCWHSGFQDFSATARYALFNGVFALTPSLSVGVPSHSYVYKGEAVVGRDLNELRLAVDAGVRLDPISSRLTISGSYSYAIVERVVSIPNNRSNTSLDAAFQLTRTLSARGMVLWQHTHGGLRVPDDVLPPQAHPDTFDQHDRLLRDNHRRFGASLTYSLPGVDLFASYIVYGKGINSHKGRAFTAGVSWPFGL